VRQKYGADRVAQIITYGKMQAKGVLRDVGRVFGVPHEDMDRFTKLVPNELKMTLEKALQVEPRIQEWLDRDPRMQDVMNMAMKLEGLHRHAGIHAAGVIIADNPITHYCPLYQSADGDWMTQFDWVSCETIGLIKFDFLGLKTLTAIQKTEEWLRQRGQPDFRIENIPYDDPGMYQLIARGDTIGVFQLESSGMQDLCRKIQPTNFEDITAINALYRPGPLGSGMVDDFINRKKGTTPITYDLAQLEPILRETYGIIVYQEQVQRIAVELASYTLGGADLLRRAMGKKKPEEMAKQREFFLSGARKNGHNPQVAENIFNLMEKFAEYGFNKSHAAAYMMVAAQTAYLKAHFPVEFYAAQMTIESGNTEQISRFIEDARRHGITVLAPHLNESEAAFTPVGESSIRFGMSSIKGVGEAAVAHLVEERRKNGAYKDLIDVIRRVDGRAVNKRVFEALIKAGVLDFSGIPRARMMAALPNALKSGERFHRDQETSQTMLFSGDDLSMTQKSFWEGYAQVAEWELTQKLGLEFDVLGSFLSGHPLEKYLAKSELYITTTLSQIQNKAADSKATVSGVVLEKRERRTRKGDKMMYVTIGDLTGTADVIVFPEAFRKFEAVLRSGEPLLVSGEVSRDQMSQQGQLRVGRDGLIRSLEQLTVSKRAEVHITMEDSADGTKMLHVAEVLKRYPGSCPTFLRVKGKVGEARLRLPSELQVELSDSMVKEIVDLCGAHSVHFVADA
jgi:DNA polymerase-3 subunit alpha